MNMLSAFRVVLTLSLTVRYLPDSCSPRNEQSQCFEGSKERIE
jgi:hypothetical protein